MIPRASIAARPLFLARDLQRNRELGKLVLGMYSSQRRRNSDGRRTVPHYGGRDSRAERRFDATPGQQRGYHPQDRERQQ
jgi:hypothetical protein